MGQCKRSFLAVAGLSVVLNVLALTISIYLMLVYDNVLASNSTATTRPHSLFLGEPGTIGSAVPPPNRAHPISKSALRCLTRNSPKSGGGKHYARTCLWTCC